MEKADSADLLLQIMHLQARLSEAHEVIDAIKNGSVDAFAMKKDGKAEVFTLQSLDYAYRVLIENFNEGALNITADGLIVYSNSYFSELTQTPISKIIGTNIIDLIAENDREKFWDHFAMALQGCSKTEISLQVLGKKIPVYISFTSIQPELATVGVIITDLSEKKQHEQTLLAKNRELEHLNKSLDQFASIASHDLQEPLRKIQTFATLFKQRFENELPLQAMYLLDRIKGSAERMSLLIQDVLNFSRVAFTENMFVDTDLNEALNATLQDFDLLISEKNASIIVGHLPVIKAIPPQINQLFYNLIGNALKFSRPRVPPAISISSRMVLQDETEAAYFSKFNLKKELLYTELSFADNGIGFDQQFAEQIFSIFERLNSRQQFEGTGIGLALCQKIVGHHQGRIHAVAEENIGATFHVLLPVTQSANQVAGC